MSSKGFQFKQFFIAHHSCAMKVGTDSIMLGSWVNPGNARTILDIGTGSGLLAIMLAQKTQPYCTISGLDIDSHAIEQARGNAQNCPWTTRLHFIHCPLQTWQSQGEFDLVVANPPYFNSQKKNQDPSAQRRLVARQTLSLSHQQLIERVATILSSHGHFYCVLPVQNALKLIEYAQTYGLFCTRLLIVKARPNSEAIRYLMAFSRQICERHIEYLTIYSHDQNYSPAYKALCQGYYLNF
ncbi:MAG: tRNA1Val (adenine37-N6)-methyltransferase [Paraglaciecola sp.]|jgi:tRNA1Val (adenine37-N6)-methyltransferase